MSKKDSIQFIEDCYSLYEQKMYRVALSILGEADAAEDAVQDAFLKLMKSKKVFDDAQSDDCKRYIIAVIKSSAISIYRVRKRDFQVISLTDMEDQLSDNQVEISHNDEVNLNEEIDKLSAKYKDIVQCLVIDNLSVRETALKLNITENTVRKRFERAKKKLKAYMKKSSGMEGGN